ncbi:MAG: hypothetical protein H0U82_07015 [Actinobacteria bacterium]|nr:hypothetical protein [Actinomycetota bacterium]
MELDEVKLLRLKLKAAKGLLRDLTIACARAEEALEREAHNAQPKEAQRDQGEARILVA